VEPGAHIAGRFIVERFAGSGGVGRVYRAHDEQTGQPVALKILGSQAMESNDFERFLREAALLARLKHPGIVRYVAHGLDSFGAPYLAMEWVEGESLSARLMRPLGIDESLILVTAIAGALGAAHLGGIIHRDVKPSNVILEASDIHRPRLLDFGIARHETGEHVFTQTGDVLGTPGYMAPEQARGLGSVDARVDVYALGCLLFRCLSGRTPFAGAHPVALLARSIVEEAPRLRELCPTVPASLDELVARLLSRDREARPADGIAVVEAIQALDTASPREQAPDRERPERLTTSAQRFVTVILATGVSGMDAILEAGRIARNHGGRLERLADGSLLLLFATADAPTDLAVRASHAADVLRAAWPDATMALASGRALLEGPAPMGEVLDRAAAALGKRERGGIVVDESTASLVRQTREAGGTTYVGRDRELAFLQGLFDECVEENAARLAVVVAPPGAGKSRLRHELLARVEAHERAPLVLLGFADPLGASTPLGMLGDALRRASGSASASSREEQASRLSDWLRGRGASASEPVLDVLGHIANLSQVTLRAGAPPDVDRNALLRGWLAWLDAELGTGPVIVVLDDLHWGDMPTVEFVDASLRAFARKPFMVLALGRPDLKKAFPSLWPDRDPQELRLGPLTRSASMILVRSVSPDLDDAAVSTIVERAGGNPFFLRELVRALAAGGAHELPDTILALVQARVESIGLEPARLLRAASIFGDTFSKDGVAALLGLDADSATLTSWLGVVVDRDLVEGKVGDGHANEAFVFRHDLVREGAYAMLTPDDRRLGHRLAGEWLSGHHAIRDPAVIAEHFSRAQDATRAIQWSCIDAERAVDAYDPSALRRAARGIELGAQGAELGRLLLAQARALDRSSDPGAGETATRAAALLPPATGLWYRAKYVEMRHFARNLAEEPFAAVASELGQTLPPPGDAGAEAEYIVAVGDAIVLAGRADLLGPIPGLLGGLFPYFPRASEVSPRAAARLESVRSIGAGLAKAPEVALVAARHAVELLRAAGEVDHIAELTVAQRLAALGQNEEALGIVAQVEADGVRLGVELATTAARFARGLAASQLDDPEFGFETGQALRGSPALAKEPVLATRLDIVVAKCAFATGRIGAGQAVLSSVLTRTKRTSPLWARLELARADGLLRAGRAREAVALVEEVRPMVQPTPFDADDGEIALLHARALTAIGEGARAKAVIEKGLATLREIAATVESAELREAFWSAVPDHRKLRDLATELGLA
jgi:hypothetical protein